MTNRRNFVKQAAAVMAMAAMPGVIQSASEEREKGLTLKRSQIKVDDQWDVIIVGGGPAGCTAAIAAAREGAKTLLIEAMGQLGGMGTAGMVPAWCPFSDGEKIIYKGLAEKIFRESMKGVSCSRSASIWSVSSFCSCRSLSASSGVSLPPLSESAAHWSYKLSISSLYLLAISEENMAFCKYFSKLSANSSFVESKSDSKSTYPLLNSSRPIPVNASFSF